MLVAGAFLAAGAVVAAVRVHGSDLDASLLRASAAAAGASSPSIPGVLAIDGAGVSVAVAIMLEGGAALAAEFSLGDNVTGAALDTTATLLGTDAPGHPHRDEAVFGALEGVARSLGGGGGTHVATKGGSDDDTAGLGLGANAAGL
jgi:hypothetical protein